MNWKTFILGAAAGFAAGYAVKQATDLSMKASPDKVLSNVKTAMKKDGKIYGSWIMMKPEPYHKFDLEYQVYKGGITRNTDGKQEQFEFVADADSGTVLEMVKN